MTTPSGTCGWCHQIRPEHTDDCPVTQTARGLAEHFSTPRGSRTPFHFTVSNPRPDDPEGSIDDLTELYRVEDEALDAAGVTFAPIDDTDTGEGK